jgi:hypothetical protein
MWILLGLITAAALVRGGWAFVHLWRVLPRDNADFVWKE